MIRLVVDAIPLTNVSTGISRYLRCLYSVLERDFSHELDIRYFDGAEVGRAMPQGPDNLARWSLMADVFWKLPSRVAYAVRCWMQSRRERVFQRVASGFDLYHEAGFFPFVAPEGVKTAFTLHDMSVHRFPEHHPRERVRFMNRFLAERTALADRILTVSEFSRNEIVDVMGENPNRIDVTPLAPDPVFRAAPKNEISRLKRRLGLPERYFLFVGSGDPRKNADSIPLALEAAELDIPLVCAGWSGWGGDMGRKRVLSLGYLTDAELAVVYSGALALVFPSMYEGFGLPVAEAQACACPVITARCASLPEAGGDAALYLENPGDVHELAGLLRRVADDSGLCADMAEKGLVHAASFSWEKTAELTFAAFVRALEGGP